MPLYFKKQKWAPTVLRKPAYGRIVISNFYVVLFEIDPILSKFKFVTKAA